MLHVGIVVDGGIIESQIVCQAVGYHKCLLSPTQKKEKERKKEYKIEE